MGTALVIRNLHAQIAGKEILKGIDLSVKPGEVHALMGPNGSGKSTLASVLMGHPGFSVSKGSVRFGNRDLSELPPDARARLGLFLSFQYPFEVQGLAFSKFLFQAYRARFPTEKQNPLQFQLKIRETLGHLHMPDSFASRDLNVGFSGGEKKRSEIAQLLLLKPSFAILDETDSGLDIDSLKLVAESVNKLRSPDFSCLVITHYKRILHFLRPDFVHVLGNGRLIASGGPELAERLEKEGYKELFREKGISYSEETK